MTVKKAQIKNLIGKPVYAVRKDKSVVTGKLVSVKGNQLILEQEKGKRVKTKALVPLVLFDLLAIGTGPYGYGGYGYPYGGYGGYGGYPGFFW